MPADRRTTSPLRPMADDEALQWLLSFVRQDLDRLESPGAWVDLGWNLARFHAAEEWAQPENREQIKRVQTAIRAVLQGLSSEGGTYSEGASVGTRYAERRGGKLHVGYETGRIETNIVDITLRLLARIDLDRLGHCKRCEALYWGQRGQLYCGKPCATAAASEAYRARKREVINTKARTGYEKKQQANLGSRVRVGRKTQGR